VRNPIRPLPMLAYAAPGFVSAFVHVAAGNILPTIYSTEFGLSLALVGTALLISRSADVILDPLIGWLSDRTGGRRGARMPWVILGLLLTALSTWFLFAPPANPGYGYFLLWYTLIYIAWSMIEIPHTAWGFEITRDYDKRSTGIPAGASIVPITAIGARPSTTQAMKWSVWPVTAVLLKTGRKGRSRKQAPAIPCAMPRTVTTVERLS